MDLSPVEVVRRAYEGWNTQDLDDLASIYHPDAVYDASERILNPEVYRGHEELRRFGAEIMRDWRSFTIELQDLIPVGDDRVIALHHSTAVGQSSGVEVQETDSATVWTVRDGQVVHARLYLDRRAAFAEAGIPYPEAE